MRACALTCIRTYTHSINEGGNGGGGSDDDDEIVTP